MTTDLATCPNAIPTVIAAPLFTYTQVELELVKAHIANCPKCLADYAAMKNSYRKHFEKLVGAIDTDPRTPDQCQADEDLADLLDTQRGAL